MSVFGKELDADKLYLFLGVLVFVVGNKSVPCWSKRRAVFGKAACRVIKRGMPCPETCHFAYPDTAFRVCYLPAAFYFVPKVEC